MFVVMPQLPLLLLVQLENVALRDGVHVRWGGGVGRGEAAEVRAVRVDPEAP
jgi:hypothetical protein